MYDMYLRSLILRTCFNTSRPDVGDLSSHVTRLHQTLRQNERRSLDHSLL